VARPRSDIAPRILHAARKRFLTEGVDGASLRAIAHDARTSIGMIYYYFPAKDDLFLAVVEEVYVALLAELEAALVRTRPVEERVRRLYERLGALTDDESQVVRLVIREVLVSPGRLERLIRRFQRGHVPLLVELVEDGVAAGLFRQDLPNGLLLAALGVLGGPAQLLLGALRGRLPASALPPAEDRATVLVDVLLHGTGAKASAARS
jgi:TetR/AcrR family transcriptional regulator